METNKRKVTLGGVLMALGIILPFAVKPFIRLSTEFLLLGWSSAVVFTLGYLIHCWEGYRSGHSFNREMLAIFIIWIVLLAIVTPTFMSSGVVYSRYRG